MGFFPRLGRGGRRLRIGYLRVFHEANAYSPRPTTRTDFERFHVLRGAELAHAASVRGAELVSFMPHAELTGFVAAAAAAGDVEAVPLVSAMAVPSGPVTAETFAWLRDEVRAALAGAGELDGVYLALHGSMQVAGLDRPPEAVLLEDVAAARPQAALAASYDPHANLTAGLIDPCVAVIAYRSNPHWDLAPTGFRAGNRLIRTLRGELSPVHAWRKLPMLLGGGTTISFLPPVRGVFQHLARMERDPKVISASLFMVHPYTTAADLGWAVHVSTNGDVALAERLADEAADAAWEMRHHGLPPRFTIEEAFERARASRLRRLGPLTFVDEADVVGAGAPGGSTRIVAAARAHAPDLRVYVPVHDPALLETLWDAPIGSRHAVVLRGTPGYDMPEVPLEVQVGVRTEDRFGRRLRLDADALRLAITDGSPLPVHPSYWAALELPARDADVLVQKNFFHYRLFHLTTSFEHLLVKSDGATSLDRVVARPHRVPVHPQVALDDWRAGDRAMRLGA